MNNANCFRSDLVEVFTTSAGKVYQSDRERALFVDFGGKIAKFSFPCLKSLKGELNSIDIENMLIDLSRPEFEFLTIATSEHCYVLSVLDIIQFRELVDGTFVMFQLNNILHDCLNRIAV